MGDSLANRQTYSEPNLDVKFYDAFDAQVKKKEMDRLNELAKLASERQTAENEASTNVVDTSIKYQYNKFIQTMSDILDDLVDGNRGKSFIQIFLDRDRMMYVGVSFIIISIAIWLIMM